MPIARSLGIVVPLYIVRSENAVPFFKFSCGFPLSVVDGTPRSAFDPYLSTTLDGKSPLALGISEGQIHFPRNADGPRPVVGQRPPRKSPALPGFSGAQRVHRTVVHLPYSGPFGPKALLCALRGYNLLARYLNSFASLNPS